MIRKKCEPVKIFTDGACSGNPGPGGWGVILQFSGIEKELSGGDENTTNNRMELMAAIKALEALTRPVSVNLYTDSIYVRGGITKWIHSWKKNNWKNASKRAVKNSDLWQRLETAASKHQVCWHWVKGHSGHKNNERADKLARDAAFRYQNDIF